jgi:hypothetical protein
MLIPRGRLRGASSGSFLDQAFEKLPRSSEFTIMKEVRIAAYPASSSIDATVARAGT